MNAHAARLNADETDRLRELYHRRRQIEKAISALEELASLRERRSNLINITQLRALAAEIN